MNITLKLYASLGEYLPQEAQRHALKVSVNNQDTPNGILKRFNVPHASIHLVLINGIYIEPAARERAEFKEGDTLAVWPPVAGG